MKKIVVFALMFSVLSIYGQETIKPKVEKKGDMTEVTYYHDNGTIEQQGTFNADGKLHGVWKSYDLDGNKTAVGNYDNGKKVGKWFFWSEDTLKEVDYIDSRVVSVNQWSNSTKLATSN
ncbi:nicotinic acid mononucleotide adenyltransferase [Winogradskyella sp. 3972H.M.0a.05]|uniref:toxin-antitoxin system YwqK family antitoxin n=1 Tax=Winogradskyella sp. 3972H.M.0a.05 TaxID=2950277 RepID=UPI00339254BE